MSASSEQHTHASHWQLLMLFMLALCLFIGIRWQPAPWLQSQINKQAKHYGLVISYDHIQRHAFTLEINHLSIQGKQLAAPILLDRLSLTPAWSALLTGHAAVRMQLQWQGQQAKAVILQQDDQIVVQDFQTQFDAASLQPILATHTPLDIKIHGQIRASGSIGLQANGHPVQGKISISWHSAGINLSSTSIPLGNYNLTLQKTVQSDQSDKTGKSNQSKSPWQWTLDGGKALILNGKGNIESSANNPQTWPVNGLIQINTGTETNMLTSLLGHSARKFKLSGNIMQPQLQPL